MSILFVSGDLGHVNKNLRAGSFFLFLEIRIAVKRENDYTFTSYGANIGMKALDISSADIPYDRFKEHSALLQEFDPYLFDQGPAPGTITRPGELLLRWCQNPPRRRTNTMSSMIYV